MTLEHKIDFVLLVSVTNANPNGDPLNGNRPREDFEGRGEISDVCIKRKIRNRLQDMGEAIFVQSNDRADDECKSLKCRYDKLFIGNKLNEDNDKVETVVKEVCNKWIDVRSFGQVFAFKKVGDNSAVSIGIRGPVSIHQAVSVSPVDIISMQITKSVNSEPGTVKASDTMGMKHRVGFGLYIVKGSINCQLAEKTGFSEEDAKMIRESLQTLFENDSSSARPEGSMEVRRLYWWEHKEKTPKCSTAEVHRSVEVRPLVDEPQRFEDYEVCLRELEGCVKPDVYPVGSSDSN